MSFKALLATSAIFAAQLVSGHSVITNAVGDAGGQGMALGVDTSTPRDGTRRNPFQQDATRFRGQAAKTVGETVGAGDNNVESGTKAIMAEMGGQLPQVSQGGNVQMTLHQVNGDGAGPYTCMINSDGTAQSWQNIQVTQNVEGNRGRNNAGAKTDHPLTAAIPANQQCTGQVAGQDNVCLVRCQNPARAGPFGGIVPVQMVGGNNGTTPNGANNAGNNNGNNNAGNNGNNNAGNNGNNNAGNNGNNGNAGNNGNNNAGNNGNNGNAGNNGNNGNAGNNGNKNAGNNGNAKNGNNNNKRDMDVGAFVKRIDSETRAIEFTA